MHMDILDVILIMIYGRNVIRIKLFLFTHHLNQRDLVQVFFLESGTKIMYEISQLNDHVRPELLHNALTIMVGQ